MGEELSSQDVQVMTSATLMSADGLDVGILLDPPSISETFQSYADLVVATDNLGFSFFAKLLDTQCGNNGGFLPRDRIEAIRSRFKSRSKNPTSLLSLPPQERIGARGIEQNCSLLHVGTLDRAYARKFMLFVPSLLGDGESAAKRSAADYVEAALYVAAYTRSRCIYFAGLGGLDGSVSDEDLITCVDRIITTRRSMKLPPVAVLFKYFAMFPANAEKKLAVLMHRLNALAAPPVLPAAEAQSRAAHAA